ncbi:hypothetical protein OAO01_00110 [Oligoflexia bacterium]|nr:hypothetical protein [Oligoflexia bacterium]
MKVAYLPYILGAIICFLIFDGMRGSKGYKHPAGIMVAEAPLQEEVSSLRKWKKDEYLFTPLATFHARARVVQSARYRFDAGAALSPVDLVLAWGPLSDTAVLEQISFRQSGRFYSWRTKAPPLPLREISAHTANMHLIPANKAVRDRLLRVQKDDIVTIEGYLVRIDRADGWHWVSSLSRNDTGGGACELIWVESLKAR